MPLWMLFIVEHSDGMDRFLSGKWLQVFWKASASSLAMGASCGSHTRSDEGEKKRSL